MISKTPNIELHVGKPRRWSNRWVFSLPKGNSSAWKLLRVQRQLPANEAFVSDGHRFFWTTSEGEAQALSRVPQIVRSTITGTCFELVDDSLPGGGESNHDESNHDDSAPNESSVENESDSESPMPWEFSIPYTTSQQEGEWTFEAGPTQPLPGVRGSLQRGDLRLELRLILPFVGEAAEESPSHEAIALLALRFGYHLPALRCGADDDSAVIESFLTPARTDAAAPATSAIDPRLLQQRLESMWLVAHQLFELLEAFQDTTWARQFCERQPQSLRKEFA